MNRNSYTGPPINRYHFEGLRNKGWIIEYALEVFKRHPNVVALLDLEIGNRFQKVIVKNFGWRNNISIILSPWMRSRAQKSWDASHWLLKAGVSVPNPLAVYTQRRAGFIVANYLVTEYIGKFQIARRILRNEIVEPEIKQLIVSKMAEMVARMHLANLIHNDLTMGNFLVKDDDYEKIYLVDLNRLERKSRLSIAERMRDIAKINLCRCHLNEEHENCLWCFFLQQYDAPQFERNLKVLKKAICKNQLRHQVKQIRNGRG
jgi:tRNA A-37 threonylcarbamoyl transferase component Bud32